MIIAWDDSDGWYDHAFATPTSASFDPSRPARRARQVRHRHAAVRRRRQAGQRPLRPRDAHSVPGDLALGQAESRQPRADFTQASVVALHRGQLAARRTPRRRLVRCHLRIDHGHVRLHPAAGTRRRCSSIRERRTRAAVTASASPTGVLLQAPVRHRRLGRAWLAGGLAALLLLVGTAAIADRPKPAAARCLAAASGCVASLALGRRRTRIRCSSSGPPPHRSRRWRSSGSEVFFDPSLSSSGKLSCASLPQPAARLRPAERAAGDARRPGPEQPGRARRALADVSGAPAEFQHRPGQ